MKPGRLFWVLVFLTPGVSTEAQLSLGRDSVLAIIQSQQVVSDTFYDAGLFRSQRLLGKKSYEDNTLYYSALIAVTLQSLANQVSPSEAQVIGSIVEGVKHNAHRYRSRKQKPAFNFWQTKPDIPHPNGPPKYQTNKYKLPDDLDDSSIIGLLVSDDSITRAIRKEMLTYNEARPKRVKTTYKKYKSSEAYGVWYADKWEQEFDICVLSNTLLFVFENNLPLTKYDSASIALIQDMALHYLDKKKFFVISPYYPEKPIILYHMARLLKADRLGVFDSIRKKIVSEIQSTLVNTKSEIHKIMLYSSLLKLETTFTPEINEAMLFEELSNFSLFSANLMSAFGSGVLMRKVINSSKLITTYRWKSEAYAWLLLYEYLVLSQQADFQTSILPSK